MAGREPQGNPPVRGPRPRLDLRRFVGLFVTAVSAVSAATVLFGLDIWREALLGAAVTLVMAGLAAVSSKRPSPRHRGAWALAVVAATLVGGYIGADSGGGDSGTRLSYASESVAGAPPKGTSRPAGVSASPATPKPEPEPDPPTTGMQVGKPIDVGSKPVALDATDAGLWFASDDGLGFLGLAAGSTEPERILIDDPPHDVAATSQLVVGTVAGSGLVYDVDSLKQVGLPIDYSEAGGPLLIKDDIAYFGNRTHSKLDKVPLRSGDWEEGDIPGVPVAMVAYHGYIYLSIEDGSLTRVNMANPNRLRLDQPTDGAPGAIVVAWGELWVSFPRRRTIKRFDLTTLKPRGNAMEVDADVRALAVVGGYLYAVSGSTDQLLRIDPRRHKVVESVGVPAGPSDLAVWHGTLYVASEPAEQITPVATP